MKDVPTTADDGVGERTADGGVIRFERHLAYPVREVWDAVLRWELEPVATGCVLRLSHFLPDVDAAIDNCCVVGLHTFLARLAPCLAGHPVGWDWESFADTQAHDARLGLAPPAPTTEDR